MLIEASKEVVEELVLAHAELRALQSGGVDNWSWYSESLEEGGFYKFYDKVEEDKWGREAAHYIMELSKGK